MQEARAAQAKTGDEAIVTTAGPVSFRQDPSTGTPVFLHLISNTIKWQSSEPAAKVYQFLDLYKDFYKLENPRKELGIVKIREDKLGMQHVTLQQMHQSLPLIGSTMTLHFRKNGDLASVTGKIFPTIRGLDLKPQLSLEEAFELAQQNLLEEKGLGENELPLLQLKQTKGDLAIYHDGLVRKKQGNHHLVWHVALASPVGLINREFFVDASTGEVMDFFDLGADAEDRETYVWSDCYVWNKDLTYTEAGLHGGATADVEALFLHNYADSVYDYYYNVHGRDSFDDSGATIKTHAHWDDWELRARGCGSTYDNAHWSGKSFFIADTFKVEGFYFGDSVVSLDVSGHEFTHAVGDYTADLIYKDESGALDEAFADIFGEMIEFYAGLGDWWFGSSLPDGPKRSMSNPESMLLPASFSEFELPTGGLCSVTRNGDHGCVHRNSSIINNAYYLLSEGGTNSVSHLSVTSGIGHEAAEQIFYHILDAGYLTSSASFLDMYDAAMQSCLDFYESDPVNYPLSYCESMYEAFTAVEISTESYIVSVIEGSYASGYLELHFDAGSSQAFGSSISSYDWDFDISVDSDGDGDSANDVDDTGADVYYTYDSAVYAYNDIMTLQLTVTAADGNSEKTSFTFYIR